MVLRRREYLVVALHRRRRRMGRGKSMREMMRQEGEEGEEGVLLL